jgi:hypothetical protein
MARGTVRECVPPRLTDAWDEYREAPERHAALVAERSAREVARQDVAILSSMILDVDELLASVIRDFQEEPARGLEALIAAQREAWQDLVRDAVVDQILDRLADADLIHLLGSAGLAGTQLRARS